MNDRVDPEHVAAAGNTRRTTSNEAAQAAREASRDANTAMFMSSMEQTIASLPADAPAQRRAAAPLTQNPQRPTQQQATRSSAPDNLLSQIANPRSNDPVGDIIENNDRAYVAAVAAVANTRLSQSQRNQAFEERLGGNQVFDLNGNGQVEPREAQAVANTIWRDSARGRSVEAIARDLTSDETLNRARDSIASENQNRGGLVVPQGDQDRNGHQR